MYESLDAAQVTGPIPSPWAEAIICCIFGSLKTPLVQETRPVEVA